MKKFPICAIVFFVYAVACAERQPPSYDSSVAVDQKTEDVDGINKKTKHKKNLKNKALVWAGAGALLAASIGVVGVVATRGGAAGTSLFSGEDLSNIIPKDPCLPNIPRLDIPDNQKWAGTLEGSVFYELKNIFANITGIGQESPQMAINFVKDSRDGCVYVQHNAVERFFCCGKLEGKTLASLRQEYISSSASTDPRVAASSDDKGSFQMVCCTRRDIPKEADICAFQANPDNADAVFQVASRMHALGGSCVHGITADSGREFNEVLNGPTQGEYASFSAAPGTIFKMYGCHPINLLQYTPFCHLIDPKKPGGVMPGIDQVSAVMDLKDNWTDELMIYFHENIDVIVGGDDSCSPNTRKVVEHKQRINQIPVSAFDWRLWSGDSDVMSNKVDKLDGAHKERLRNITLQMLSGFYEGTLLASALKKKHKIFLTAVGAGEFQNDLDLVIAAIANKKNLEIIKQSHLNVTLVIHCTNQAADIWVDRMYAFWNTDGINKDFIAYRE